MKTLPTIVALALASTAPLALADNNCDVNLDANFSLKNNHIVFSNDHHELYQISDDNELIIDSKVVDLSSSQQATVDAFATGVRDSVPQVRTVAIEGVNIAIEGVNLAFNGLLGEGNDVSEELTYELTEIREQLARKLDSETGIYIGSNEEVAEDILGEDFEQRFEQVLESAIEKSMGSLLMAVGREMMFSGGDMEAFETRMEDFGQNIESQMEARAETLEQAADELCQALVTIDELEDDMQDAIPQLRDIDVLHIHGHRHNDI